MEAGGQNRSMCLTRTLCIWSCEVRGGGEEGEMEAGGQNCCMCLGGKVRGWGAKGGTAACA